MAWHDEDSELFPEDIACRLDVGYVLNDLETGISDIRVVSRTGKKVSWQYSLMDALFLNDADVAHISNEKASGPAVRLRYGEVANNKDNTRAKR
jgi:hypothetical protein